MADAEPSTDNEPAVGSPVAPQLDSPPAAEVASLPNGEEETALDGSKEDAEPLENVETAPEAVNDEQTTEEKTAEGQEDYSEAWKQYYAAQEAAAAAASQSVANGQNGTASTSTPSSAPPEKKAGGGHAADGNQRGVLNPQKIYIGGLPEHTSQDDLQDCFGQIGEVLGVELKNGFGFVEFADPQAASDAVSKYHGGHFLGAEIRVELSHNGSRAKPYVGGEAGACFKCGRTGHWARDCQMPLPGRGGPGMMPFRGRGGPPGFGGPMHGGFNGPQMGRGGFHGGPAPGFQPFPQNGPPMQGGYDPRAPFPRPHDDYYRREHPGQYQGGAGYMNGPPPYMQGPPYQQQHPYANGPPGFMPQRGSAWGGQPQGGMPGSPTFGGLPQRGADPHSGFSARPPNPSDPYGASQRPYDPTAARERSPPHRRRSLSPSRRSSFMPNPPNLPAAFGGGYPAVPGAAASAPYRG